MNAQTSNMLAASDTASWRQALACFDRVDVCHMPEYHQAYSLRINGSTALMWQYQSGDDWFCYPFLLSPVLIDDGAGGEIDSGYFDISGIYGYSGPLSTNDDRQFLEHAWANFDAWCLENRVVSEFVRFSTYVDNIRWAHPGAIVEYNRPVALAVLPETDEEFLRQLNGKTRNMIRKAGKLGLQAKACDIRECISDFRTLYDATMARNQATQFFMYDDEYYERLLSLPEGELVLFAVYEDDAMTAAAIGLIHGDMAFYHLGASTMEASKQGAGNLVLFELATYLMERDVSYFSVGGGRTPDEKDPLFRFKKSNATSVGEYYIGKRVILKDAYREIIEKWTELHAGPPDSDRIQFYR